ncbi:MAG: hypothetical protein CMP57_00715 [Flavobacteriales bacterium]|nr:hypothetical protein [Flavobacteriales bacterium]|tara:strand:+ start:8640 stop:9404 length:765 start_codon:yes stop_codon:yes gene_type:complete
MKEKLNVVAISYLNTLPFLYGIRKDKDLMNQLNLRLEYPSLCADLLKSGNVDVGLIPVTEILQLDDPRIIGDFCIGAKGKVNTVMLYSYCPLLEIKTIALDYQSRTSVMLTKILFDKFWNKKVDFESTSEGYISLISGNVAGLVIGDRAFDYKDKFPYSYDLSEEWLNFTGLPFVFACWVSRIPLDPIFEAQFCKALALGFSNMQDVVDLQHKESFSEPHLNSYLNKDISYEFDEDKKTAMTLFLSYCQEINNQ